jgi:hypothetical protein
MARIPVSRKIAISCLVAAGAVFLCRDLALPRTVSLTLEARADSPQTLLVLYNDGSWKGFGTRQSIPLEVGHSGPHTRLRADIHIQRLKGLRLDFQSVTGRVSLKNIRLTPKGPLSPETIARCERHQIDSLEINGDTIRVSFNNIDPYLVFDRQDVATEACRRPNLPLVFGILVLAYLLAFRAMDWVGWEQPLPDPAIAGRPHKSIWRKLASPDGCFLLAFAVFSGIPASRIDTQSTVSKENRLLESYRPLVQDFRINTQYGSQFEAWFSDRFRHRLAVIHLHRSLRNLLDRPETAEAFEGDDGWLFYQSNQYGDPVGDYIGNNHHPESFKRQAAAQVLKARDALQAQGIQLVLMIPPNKEQIHSKYFRSRIRQANEFSRTDDLVKHLREQTGIPIVYPKQEMMELSDRYELYHKSDTHWNALGAFVAEQQLVDTVYGSRKRLEDQAIVKTARTFPDLANMLSIPPADYSYALSKASMKPYRRPARDMQLCLNRKAPHADTLMLVGDSFRNALRRFLRGDFRSTFVLPRQHFTPELLAEIRPDILVLEYVERNSFEIGTLPPFLLEPNGPTD